MLYLGGPGDAERQVLHNRGSAGTRTPPTMLTFASAPFEYLRRRPRDISHVECVGRLRYLSWTCHLLLADIETGYFVLIFLKLSMNQQCSGWNFPPLMIRVPSGGCSAKWAARVNKHPRHRCGEDNNIQAPATTQATPAARATHRPSGASFSKRTSSARSAIQSTFITPPTNKSVIRTQQQPTQ